MNKCKYISLKSFLPTSDQGCIQKFRLGGVIAIELPEKLSDHDLETKLNIWNRKPRRISI